AEGERPGGLLARLGAVIVDGVIVSAMDVLLVSPAGLILYFRPALSAAPAASDPLLFGTGLLCVSLAAVANVLYLVAFWALRGRTPGKALLGLAIVRRGGRVGDGIGWSPALLRWLVMGLGGIPFGLGWWIAAFRKDRRAWHDLAAGTRVVRTR
ncbi:MAG TPA: RDD family protein, partial [Thermoanaerobaculia bacterium]|nr:RDD family protein [Thermoanaerobaculia bacterium]